MKAKKPHMFPESNSLAKFFHNGKSLRKDAISVSIQKVQEILRWFESHREFHFYASSLLFVYEGSLQENTQDAPKAVGANGGARENNNNNRIHVSGSAEIAKATVVPEQALSTAQTKGTCQPDTPCHEPCNKGDSAVRKRNAQISLEQANGNKISGQRGQEGRGLSQHCSVRGRCHVDVRMIDFAHVFPSETRDEGYIYGLKSLLSVLQEIMDQ
ncbi:hypothetical protein JZ751_018526 [Albula glossodonta]|uniref:Kinase n=1 Tax=Albula glossodonta TaxID=121402 RepID=A0A8T2NP15_9TELE|nr:hypothetical protein JZ751_018526 [Albula glossodonta]